MTEAEIRASLARWRDAGRRRDAAAFAAEYSEDCVVTSLISGTLRGRTAVENSLRVFHTSFPDVTSQHEDPLIFGDRAVLLFTLRCTDTGGFLGAPTGRPM